MLSDQLPPVPEIRVRHRPRRARTSRNREHPANRSVDVVRQAGPATILRSAFPPLVLHVQSPLRMGARADDSVLDGNAAARVISTSRRVTQALQARGLA